MSATIHFPNNPPTATPEQYYNLAVLPSKDVETSNSSNTPQNRSQQRVSRNDRYDNPADTVYGAPLSSPLLPLLLFLLLILLHKLIKYKILQSLAHLKKKH